ncbi:hypothetical protein [Akkermansia sp.]|uniref:hypothetical protein n=1 Tax=Akkermansia sp. TaxID=1872421 RepID=UPI00293048AE|nr:hypothetical protein [Akkermansia sp.]
MMRMNPGALGRKRKNTSATAFSVIHSIGQLEFLIRPDYPETGLAFLFSFRVKNPESTDQ